MDGVVIWDWYWMSIVKTLDFQHASTFKNCHGVVFWESNEFKSQWIFRQIDVTSVIGTPGSGESRGGRKRATRDQKPSTIQVSNT